MILQVQKIHLIHLHFLLIPVFFIVHNYFEFYGLIDYTSLLTQFVTWLVTPFILYIFFLLVFKSSSAAALFTSFMLLIYFFTASLYQSLQQISILKPLIRISIMLPIIVLIMFFIFIQLKKNPATFRKLHGYLITVLASLIAYNLFAGMIHGTDYYLKRNRFQTENVPLLVPTKNNILKPDIYFLIFDEHPSSVSIKELTGYDNTMLDSSLTSLGFKVSPFATSGFPQTIHALCSVMDMGTYPYDDNHRTKGKDMYAALPLLYDNALFRFLHNEGYKIFNSSFINFKYAPSLKNTTAHDEGSQKMITHQTLFHWLDESVGWLRYKYFPALFNNPLEKTFEEDDRSIKSSSRVIDSLLNNKENNPRFVVAHFFIPHVPYKYDSTGVLRKKTFNEYNKEASSNEPFIQQIAYTRNFILKTVSTIKEKSQGQSIIIVQGDHGLRIYDHQKFGSDEMFKILSAVYFPDKDYSQIEDNHFAPNTFRVLLNKFFSQNLPMQKEWHKKLLLGQQLTK